MTLFAEAIKGSGNSLHSTGPDIFRALVRSTPEEELVPGHNAALWTDVCRGVLTSIVHHSTPETFGPMAEAVVTEAMATVDTAEEPAESAWRKSALLSSSWASFPASAGGQGLLIGPAIVQTLSSLLEAVSKCPPSTLQDPSASMWMWRVAIANTAITWSQASEDALIPSISRTGRYHDKGALNVVVHPLLCILLRPQPGSISQSISGALSKVSDSPPSITSCLDNRLTFYKLHRWPLVRWQ